MKGVRPNPPIQCEGETKTLQNAKQLDHAQQLCNEVQKNDATMPLYVFDYPEWVKPPGSARFLQLRVTSRCYIIQSYRWPILIFSACVTNMQRKTIY